MGTKVIAEVFDFLNKRMFFLSLCSGLCIFVDEMRIDPGEIGENLESDMFGQRGICQHLIAVFFTLGVIAHVISAKRVFHEKPPLINPLFNVRSRGGGGKGESIA